MKIRICKLLAMLLCVSILVVSMGNTAFAASKTSGKCGKNAKWSYNKKTRTLTISGKGTIKSVEWPEYHKVNVVIKKGVTGIGANAFYDMYITKLTLPSTLTTIGNDAFVGSLPSTITIPKNVTKVGAGAFAICDRLKSIKVEKGNKKFVSVDGVLFNKGKTELIAYPAGKSKKYVIPKGTKIIGKGAFKSDKLEELTIPSTVKEFKEEALGSSFKILRFEGDVPKRTQEELKNEAVCFNLKTLYYPEKYTKKWLDVEKKHKSWYLKNWDEDEKYKTRFIRECSGALLISGEDIGEDVETIEMERAGFRHDIQSISTVIASYCVNNNSTIMNKAEFSDCRDLESRIEEAYQFTDSNSVSYFYYTGHGGVAAGIYGFESVSYNNLACYLNDHTKGTIVVILDVCYSNQFSFSLNRYKQLKSRCVVLAATMSEQYSKSDENGGFFTNAVKKALTRKGNKLACDNGDGDITLDELYAFVKEDVQKQTNGVQTPMKYGDGSKIIFRAS